MADARDPLASEHLEGCDACFQALEAADPIVRLLRAARPSPHRAPARTVLTIAVAAAVLLIAAAIEAALAAQPVWLAPLLDAEAALAEAVATWLAAGESVRAVLLDMPALLGALSLVTVAAFALWLRLALRIPNWRSTR
jgi:hypothetical protein